MILCISASAVVLASCGVAPTPPIAGDTTKATETVTVSKYPDVSKGEFGIVQPDVTFSNLSSLGACPNVTKSYDVCQKSETAYSYALKSDTPRQVTASQKYWVCGNVEVSFDVYKAKVAAGAKGCYESTKQVNIGMQHICLWGRYESVYNVVTYYKYGKVSSTSRNLSTYRQLSGQDISRTLTTTCPNKPTT